MVSLDLFKKSIIYLISSMGCCCNKCCCYTPTHLTLPAIYNDSVWKLKIVIESDSSIQGSKK